MVKNIIFRKLWQSGTFSSHVILYKKEQFFVKINCAPPAALSFCRRAVLVEETGVFQKKIRFPGNLFPANFTCSKVEQMCIFNAEKCFGLCIGTQSSKLLKRLATNTRIALKTHDLLTITVKFRATFRLLEFFLHPMILPGTVFKKLLQKS